MRGSFHTRCYYKRSPESVLAMEERSVVEDLPRVPGVQPIAIVAFKCSAKANLLLHDAAKRPVSSRSVNYRIAEQSQAAF